MEDRDVQFPNRYRITKVKGTDDIYDFEPVPGEVTEDGSLVNKSLLFSDIAAGMFGLFGDDATPNKAFEFLGKFNQHWWKRVTNGVYVEAEGSPITTIFTDQYNTNRHSIKYSDSVVIDSNTGSVSLGEPIKTISISVYGGGDGIVDSAWDNIKGKYFVPHIDGADADYIAFLNSNAEISFQYDAAEYYNASLNVPSGKCYKVASKISEGETFYVYSDDRNKYPDDGEQDGYEYQYLGVPFEGLPATPKVEYGKYIGTGTSGSNKPNNLTFKSIPKLVFVTPQLANVPDQVLFLQGVERTRDTNATNGTYNIIVSWSDKQLIWYGPDAGTQLNTSGIEYRYIAFC